MSEFVKKTIVGYKALDGGHSDPECTHVILALEEYDDLLKEISRAKRETREEKSKAAAAQKESEQERQAVIQQYEEVIEKWKAAFNKAQTEIASQKGLNENLLRIARERANADRKLKPKKEHSGYVVVVSSEKLYRYKNGRYLASVKLWETVIQSPYSIEFPAKQAKKQILQEFFPKYGEWSADGIPELQSQLSGWVLGNGVSSYETFGGCPKGYESELKEAETMKQGLCSEDAVTHNLTVVWIGLDAGELKEGEQLEIQVAGHWIEVELERDPDGGWSWRDLETGWSLKRTDVSPVSVRKIDA